MNTANVETRLKNASLVAAAPRSIVEEVMRELPALPPKPAPRLWWRRSIFAATLAIPTAIAAALVFFVFFSSTVIPLTLADIQAAVERQAWVHIQYDVGQLKEAWTNLRTGEQYAVRTDGGVVYINERANTRIWYQKQNNSMRQDAPTQYAPGQSPPPWTPRTAWEQIVAPLEKKAAATEGANPSPPSVINERDTLDGKVMIRFDSYSVYSVGKRFLRAQLWADPKTRLPVRVSTRLQLGEREAAKKEWSTGAYDFPATGPADIYALGVPRDVAIAKAVTTAPADVAPIVDRISRAHDNFLKTYRAVIWTVDPRSLHPIEALDVIWRDGKRLRQDHHLPAFEFQEKVAPALPEPNLAELVAWAAKSDATFVQLMDGEREYVRSSADRDKGMKARVHVIRSDRFPLLATNAWPETIQWPTRYFEPNFERLDANADTPAGCIGLRTRNGDSRSDYFIDPENDHVCMKQIHWKKRGGEWAKVRETILSDLRQIDGHVVAGSLHRRHFGYPPEQLADFTEITTIDFVPLTAAEFPPGIFDPAKVTANAEVEGY